MREEWKNKQINIDKWNGFKFSPGSEPTTGKYMSLQKISNVNIVVQAFNPNTHVTALERLTELKKKYLERFKNIK